MKVKFFFLFIILCNFSISSQTYRTIKLDALNTTESQKDMYLHTIGAGRANEGLRADWQEQLKITKDECGFKYIRFHGIFHEDMGVHALDETGNDIYNWQYVDKLYDFILSIKMKPFVELSFMPKELASGVRTVFWWKGNVTPPKSLEAYKKLIYEFTKHLTERYGEKEVKTWYFEVWNEPNHHSFFTGKIEDYYPMYKEAVAAIKSISKDYKVGGPATAGNRWIDDFLEITKKDNIPVDFVSTHAYNTKGFLDEFGKSKLILHKDSVSVVNQLRSTINKIKVAGYENIMDLYITEWSSSYSPKDAIHDTYQNATFVLNTLKNTGKGVNSMSYWVFTDIFEEAGVPMTPFHGGFGLLNLQGIKKPTYFAYKYLNQLKGQELVSTDKQSWAYKDKSNINILLYDMLYPKQGEVSNNDYFIHEIKSQYTHNVSIDIKNIEKGTYQLQIFKTGYLNNDAYTEYIRMGKPSQLSINQENTLKNLTKDVPIKNEKIEIKTNNFKYNIEINENDIVLIKLQKR